MESDDPNGHSDDDSYSTDAEEVEWEHIEPQLSQAALQAEIAGFGTALEEAEADETQQEDGTSTDVLCLLEVRRLLLDPANVRKGHAEPSRNFPALQCSY